MILLNFLIAILLYNSVVVTEALQDESTLSTLAENLKAIPSHIIMVKDVPRPGFLREFPLFDEPDRVYRELNVHQQSNDSVIKINLDPETFTSSESKIMLDYVNVIIKNLISNCQKYIGYMATVYGRDKKCDEVKKQSFNHIAYNTFLYISSVLKNANIIIQVTCLTHYENGWQHLEMVKFLQGIFPQEITLNKWNSAKGTCTDYNQQGTAYYPYKTIRHDGDWKCHGLMYECFTVSQTMEICKPSFTNRRLDGIVQGREYSGKSLSRLAINPFAGFQNMGHCYHREKWTLFDWRYPMPFSFYDVEQCACICDDLDHPKTLRRFSREYAMSDFKNNRVVTGIRLVKISNVIHIQIQEGKLEEFGFINSSTVQWRLKNNIVNRSKIVDSRSSDDVVTLSYHKRRVNLDLFYSTPNDVVIGAAFDWTQEMDGVELTVFITHFSFSTGELNQDYRKRIAPNGRREEIVLKNPSICYNNYLVEGDNKFIKFQTTDWISDAAQATIPYLDIEEVITDPPTMLRGVGLYFGYGHKCTGYIGLELHSHNYENLIF